MLFNSQSNSLLTVQNLRIDFQFDRAAFDFKRLPVKIPYPVPFKLLGDETKVQLSHKSCDFDCFGKMMVEVAL